MSRSVFGCVLAAAALTACRESDAPLPAVTPDSLRAASIDVQPPNATLNEGDTLRFTATVKDSNGALIAAKVRWSSQADTLISIDSTGLARALLGKTGTQTATAVVAKYGRVQREVSVLHVSRVPLSVWPDTNVLFVGMTRTLVARGIRAESGYPSPDVVSMTADHWSSSDATVAIVSATGQITAAGTGHAKITAAMNDGRTSTAEVYVTSPPAVPLRFSAVGTGPVVIRASGVNPPFGPDYDARSCGLSVDGGVYCWGVATEGMSITDRCERTVRTGPARYSLYRYRCNEIPNRVATSLTFTALVARGPYSCAIATTKRVYCWGTNTNGELGLGSTDSTTVHGVAAIASTDEFRSLHGEGSICAIRVDDVAFCWGQGFSAIPMALSGGVAWRMMADAARCGLAADSTAYCLSGTTPMQSGGTTRWASIATVDGLDRACALSLAGRVYCGSAFNSNDFASLASGEPPLASLGTFYPNYTYSGSICGLSAEGDMYCVQALAGYAHKLTLVNLSGLKLKRFFGNCGITTDDKTYCWTYNMTSNTSTIALVPGQ